MSTVSIENVQRAYGSSSGTVAVDDISSKIAGTEFLTIVGPSGSGKSTLLRTIAGLEDITGGTIRIEDRAVNDVQPQDRDIVMVFQNYALYPHMTAHKNMSCGLQLTTNLPEDEINQRMMDVAEMMGVTDRLDRHPGDLPRGQQQYIATGHAIVREPPVFLFGEPLPNLNARLRLHIRTEPQQLQDTLGTTTVYVTHDQKETMTISDYIAVVDGGELQRIGTPEGIYNEPQNLFVGDFVGSPPMSQFEVRLSGTSLVADGFSCDLSERVLEHIKQYVDGIDGFALGTRPENISLTDSDEPNTVRAFLDVRGPVGSDSYLHFDIEGEECWVRVPGDIKPDTNQELSLALDEERLRLFRQSDGIDILTREELPLEVMAGRNT